MKPKRLFLFALGLGNKQAQSRFYEEISKAAIKRVAIIPTASNEHKEQNKYTVQVHDALINMGVIQIDYIDVEFNDAKQLKAYDLIYLGSGNPFHLLHHLKASGADKVIREAYAEGTVLAGASAGAVVLTPNIRIALLIEPRFSQHAGDNTTALNLVDFTIVPHANTYQQTYSNFAEMLESAKEQLAMQIYPLSDDRGIYVHNGELHFFP